MDDGGELRIGTAEGDLPHRLRPQHAHVATHAIAPRVTASAMVFRETDKEVKLHVWPLEVAACACEPTRLREIGREGPASIAAPRADHARQAHRLLERDAKHGIVVRLIERNVVNVVQQIATHPCEVMTHRNEFGRRAWVGVDSRFGTVKAGLQFSPVFLAVYDFDPREMSYFGVWYTHDGNNSTNHSVMASTGVEYSLSKATMIYGHVGFVNNHGAMHTGLSVNNALNEVTGTTSGVNVGIRHMF